nr:MAG TPA: hypothetical protein [Bacteriophage sp.]
MIKLSISFIIYTPSFLILRIITRINFFFFSIYNYPLWSNFKII